MGIGLDLKDWASSLLLTWVQSNSTWIAGRFGSGSKSCFNFLFLRIKKQITGLPVSVNCMIVKTIRMGVRE